MSIINSIVRGVSSRSSASTFQRTLPNTKIPKVYPNGFSLLPLQGDRKERLQFPEYKITVPKGQSLKKAVNLAYISDVHYDGINGDWLNRAIPHIRHLIKNRNIDVLLLGGDYICQGNGFIRDFGKWVESLNIGIPMIGILGNHDYLDGAGGKTVAKALRDAGIIVLEDQTHIQSFGKKGKIAVHGLKDYLLGKPDVNKVLANIQNMSNMTHIGLVHNPKQFEVDARLQQTLPITLAGHTHGGQIVGMSHRLAQRFTQQKFVKGLYQNQEGQGDIFVGAGMGTGTILLDKHHHPKTHAFLKWLGVKKEKGLSFALPRWWEGFSEMPIITLVPDGTSNTNS